MNAIQAMSGVTDAERDLHIAAASAIAEGTSVMVRDSGPEWRG
jgi:C4-dicarboxylate-specific signal transduction histidine kinase